LILALVSTTLCAVISPTDPNIYYSGRTYVSGAAVLYDWPGVQFEFFVKGAQSIDLVLQEIMPTEFSNEKSASWLNVFLDGHLVNIVTLTDTNHTYKVIDGINDQNVHDVLITKRTEPIVGIVAFQGIILSGGSLVPSPSPLPTRKIEFYGDSITCGFGNEGLYGCDFTPPTENNYNTYASLIAHTVKAQYFVQAWSGKGVIRNCCNQNITTPNPLPSYLPFAVANNPQYKWNFTKWIPDAVVINLGTNDYSTQPQPPEDLFVKAYIAFIKSIRQQYARAVPHFFLICGPMIGDPCCEYVESVADQTGATYVDLQGILTAPFDYGCDGHPSVSGHYKMSQKAVPIIQQTMKWT